MNKLCKRVFLKIIETFIETGIKLDPKVEYTQLQVISQISNIKSLENYFKRLSYPTSTHEITQLLHDNNPELSSKLLEINTFMSKFANKSIINTPIKDEIQLDSIDKKLLSSEFHDYLRSDINLFSIHEQMSERAQVKVLKDWLNTMITSYVKSVPEHNLTRVSHSLLLISYTMDTISKQIKK